ncbi:MAG TPA: hypothetical protein VH328_07115, partial [Burkholderiaceae bacterium]|nr:hypothetical protein [Burkholderiaceae bacterium]
MHFRFLAQVSPPLDPQLQWLLWSQRSRSFLTGDERRAFAIPVDAPDRLTPLGPEPDPDRPFHPCNLPIGDELVDEPALRAWCGFQFLERAAYDHAIGSDGLPAGDLLRTLVFGPDYGHYVLHPPTGAILALKAGGVELLRRTTGGFERVERTRTRGRAALAFAGHPHEGLVAYGDNAGDFHVQRVSADGFGKASRIAAKQRKASALAFTADGARLFLGGMGYLAALGCEAGKFRPLHETAMAVRDFELLDDGAVLVNQGIHGVAAWRY